MTAMTAFSELLSINTSGKEACRRGGVTQRVRQEQRGGEAGVGHSIRDKEIRKIKRKKSQKQKQG
jgi:hypothetical protein